MGDASLASDVESFDPSWLETQFSAPLSPSARHSGFDQDEDAPVHNKRPRVSPPTHKEFCASSQCSPACSGQTHGSLLPTGDTRSIRPLCPLSSKAHIDACNHLKDVGRHLKAMPMRRTSTRDISQIPTKIGVASMASTDSDDQSKSGMVGKSEGQKLKDSKTKQPKTSHCVIERRYRENLNDKFTALRNKLPGMHQRSDDDTPGSDIEDSIATTPSKVTKADILTQATDYVRQSEKQMKSMREEILFMRDRMAVLEKLVACEDCWLLNEFGKMRVDSSVEPPIFGDFP